MRSSSASPPSTTSPSATSHLACEAVSDIASHLIADSRFRQPENYRDAVEVLAEERVIEPSSAASQLLQLDGGRSDLAAVEVRLVAARRASM